MLRRCVLVVSVSLLGLLSGCAAGGSSTTSSSSRAEVGYSLVQLRTGPTRGLSKQEQQEAFNGHFANMARLAGEGSLVLAGPYGETRHASDLRGLFVLDTADRARAQELAATDPAAQRGIFKLEYHDLVTAAPLREVLAASMAEQERARAEGRETQPGEGCRNYVLLTAERGDQALAALREHPSVLLLARLDGRSALAVVDATSQAQARERLGTTLVAIGPFVFDDWFATENVARLCAPRRS